jgi:hypothetical protein
LEGLEPTGPVRELVDLWIQGDATDDDLREAERRLLAGVFTCPPPPPSRLAKAIEPSPVGPPAKFAQ